MIDFIKDLGVDAKANLLKLKAIFSEEQHNSRDMLVRYGRYLSGDSSKQDLEKANADFRELLKVTGLGAFCILPGTMLTLPILAMVAKKLGMDIFPSSFYRQFPDLKKTKNAE